MIRNLLRLLFLLVLLALSLLLLSSPCYPATVSISLHPVKLSELARVVYGDLLKNSFVLQSEFLLDQNEVSVNWQNLSSSKVDQLTRDLIRAKGFEIVQTDKVLTVRKSATSDDDLLVYKVVNRSSKYLADMISKVVNVQQLGSRGIPAPSGSTPPAAEVAGSASSNFDRSALDQLIYSCRPAECVRLRSLLVQLDTKEPNVILRAVIYEVATNHNDGSAISLAVGLFRGNKIMEASAGSSLAGAASLHINAGGLDAVITALDSDSRFKSLSRPSLRVKTGATAKFSVGSQTPILGAISYDKNGAAVQSVEYRPSGTIFTVTPDIRGDAIDLQVNQELSSFAVTTSGVNNSPTLLQRTASSTLTVHDSEVIIFAGLEETKDDEAKNKIFGFIPLSKKSSNSKSEILLFIEAQRL